MNAQLCRIIVQEVFNTNYARMCMCTARRLFISAGECFPYNIGLTIAINRTLIALALPLALLSCHSCKFSFLVFEKADYFKLMMKISEFAKISATESRIHLFLLI